MSESNMHTHKTIEGDLSSKVNRLAWIYFVGLGLVLYLLIVGLSILFRMELKEEDWKKVGSVPSDELSLLRQQEKEVLSGKKGIGEGVKPKSIEEAMKQIEKVYSISK